MKDSKASHDGRLGGSGQNRRASGTGQERVNAMRDTGAMTSKLESCCTKHPMKSGKTAKL